MNKTLNKTWNFEVENIIVKCNLIVFVLKLRKNIIIIIIIIIKINLLLLSYNNFF